MSGVRNGVQAIFKREEPRALYVHCLAHSLNLCVQDTSKVCTLIRNTMDFIHDLIQLIKFLPKRLTMFDSLRKDVALNSGESSPSLRILSYKVDSKTFLHNKHIEKLQNFDGHT